MRQNTMPVVIESVGDLEPAICELAHIAAITRFYVSECSDRAIDADRIITVISHVADMAEDLRTAYYAGVGAACSDIGGMNR